MCFTSRTAVVPRFQHTHAQACCPPPMTTSWPHSSHLLLRPWLTCPPNRKISRPFTNAPWSLSGPNVTWADTYLNFLTCLRTKAAGGKCYASNRAEKVTPSHAKAKTLQERADWLKKKKKTACKVISCSRDKQIVNESCWIPRMLLNTWNISAALDLTSSPSYLACRMNFDCQKNLTLYYKSLLNTDGDFLVAQKSAKKNGGGIIWNRPLHPRDDFYSHSFKACKCSDSRCCLYVPSWTNGFSVMKTLCRSTNSSTAYWLF